jgi:hypothetical protein
LVRLSAEEAAELDQAASRAGVTMPSYLRQQGLTKPKTRSMRRPAIEQELLARVLGQLGKIGSNLNQIAHAANMDEQPGLELDLALAELRGLVPVILEAMGRRAPLAEAPVPAAARAA